VAASIKEVARRAGVSLGTVSNVLNRPDAVTPATRQRVLEAIAELGYVRNDSARQLRAGRSRTVAIVVLDVSNPFFTDVVAGAESVVEAGGGMLIVCNSGEDPSREHRHLDMLEEQRVQGLLITPVSDGPQPRLERFIERGIPVVLVDRGAASTSRCSVAVDDVLGGRLAATHLLDAGHRHLAFVGGPIALIQNGDSITIDAHKRIIQLNVPEKEIAARRKKWKQPKARYTRGVMAKYVALVSTASRGAVTD